MWGRGSAAGCCEREPRRRGPSIEESEQHAGGGLILPEDRFALEVDGGCTVHLQGRQRSLTWGVSGCHLGAKIGILNHWGRQAHERVGRITMGWCAG